MLRSSQVFLGSSQVLLGPCQVLLGSSQVFFRTPQVLLGACQCCSGSIIEHNSVLLKCGWVDFILPHFLHVFLALNQDIFLCFFLRHFWRTAFKMESIMSCKYWKTSQTLPGGRNLPFSFTGLGLFDRPRESTNYFRHFKM